MKYKFLSYALSNHLPVYGKMDTLNIQSQKSIQKGDSCNTYCFSLNNHWGTHIDAPNHFIDKGKKIAEFDAENFIFKAAKVIELKLDAEEILRSSEWLALIDKDTDILLIKSNWWKHRSNNIYMCNNPGIHAEVGFELRKNFPKLRAVGFDWISLSSYKHRELGAEAHRAFLDPDGIGDPLFVIEDMDLSIDLSSLCEVIVSPLRIKGIDSGQCTVIGVFNE
ncbi:MAG: cyclase [bacterium]|nr:cyclase [bacterium]